MKYWSPDDYHAPERLAWTPEPPSALLLRKLEWFAEHGLHQNYSNVRSASRAALETFRGLPEWPKTRTPAERRAAMHQLFVEPAETFDPSQSGNLVFAGPSGAGKTLAALHALFSLWQRGLDARQGWPSAMFLKATAVANARRNARLGEEPAILEKARTVGLLLLDDIGQGCERDSSLVEVVDARYDAGLPTIATTGLDTEQFKKDIGEMVLRRLVQTTEHRGRVISAFPKAKLQAVPVVR